MKHTFLYIFVTIMMALSFVSCADEGYTSSSAYTLYFPSDSLFLDTVFAEIPSARKEFWVYNRTSKHMRLSQVAQERGNQSGFRVNVDGIYLGPAVGYRTSDVEVRAGDSIRVFVELTSARTGQKNLQRVKDNIVFTLESGSEQKVALEAMTCDATIMRDAIIANDTLLTSQTPIVIYGKMTVMEGATLTIEAGTELYFRDDASLEVRGRLVSRGERGNEVVMRGYRLDRMFDYLPYDNVSGQWGGVKLCSTSRDNILTFTDIHSAYDGMEIDSCGVEKTVLTMRNSTIHNCQGYGIKSKDSKVEIRNSQITNTLNDCVFIDGGEAEMNSCTLAQFYPFDSSRGVALHWASSVTPVMLTCRNTLVTGYANSEVLLTDTVEACDMLFADCILRVKKEDFPDTLRCDNVIYEASGDEIPNGDKHFVNIDTENLVYDYHLLPLSPAVDAANALTSEPDDRDGRKRDEKRDIGCYECVNEEKESN